MTEPTASAHVSDAAVRLAERCVPRHHPGPQASIRGTHLQRHALAVALIEPSCSASWPSGSLIATTSPAAACRGHHHHSPLIRGPYGEACSRTACLLRSCSPELSHVEQLRINFISNFFFSFVRITILTIKKGLSHVKRHAVRGRQVRDACVSLVSQRASWCAG